MYTNVKDISVHLKEIDILNILRNKQAHPQNMWIQDQSTSIENWKLYKFRMLFMTNKSSWFAVIWGISRLGSPFIFQRRSKLAHHGFQVTNLHMWHKQRIYRQGNRYHVTLGMVSPESASNANMCETLKRLKQEQRKQTNSRLKQINHTKHKLRQSKAGNNVRFK